MEHKRLNQLEVNSNLMAGAGIVAGIKRGTLYHIEAFRDGKLLWTEDFHNLVVNAGLDDSLDKHLKGNAYTAAWYVGVTGADPVFAAADTMSGGHAGWTESSTYDEANRPTLTLGAVSGQSVSNTASRAVFTISGSVTLGGAFVVSTNNKGGATGILYGGGVFSQNRVLVDNDVLNVTVTCTAAST